ncbi:peptidase C45 [Tistrella bauzanensis]|uniref:Peptidase C45 n=1 Tax=Tistrella bauzanensis TaxID=657419 RepID=A0ABQ1IEU1_9PROT|nr:C45 family peptidase [Tistrella bauzanensis]GGB37121.1 peptidase C45 [Tistrella bauzanensis]
MTPPVAPVSAADVTDFPMVELAGTAFERGQRHGQALKTHVLGSVALYAAQLRAMNHDWAGIAAIAREFLPVVEGFDGSYVEEMRGIAQGAGCDLEHILLINARTEILQIGRMRAGIPDEEPDGCTGAVVLGAETAHGRLIHGQNWDWRPECAHTTVVLKIRRDDGPDLLTMTEAGGLARCGMNSAGIAITANYLECDRDYAQVGVPLALIRRKVLEQAHMALAMKTVATTPKSASNNMMLSWSQGFAIDFECAPDEAFQIYPDADGMIVHANHWTSPVALSKLRDTGIPFVPESFYRDWRVRRALAARRGQITRADLKAAFFDDFGVPYSVCRPPRPGAGGSISSTVAMVVMEPAAGVMEVAPMPALRDRFTTYTLDMDETATRDARACAPARPTA